MVEITVIGTKINGRNFKRKLNSSRDSLLILNSKDLSSIDLSPLVEFNELREIKIAFNYLTEIDLSPLAGMKELKWIGLSSNQIAEIDLSPLAGINTIEEIDLCINKLKEIDLSPLAGMKKLRWVNLNNNLLTEIDLSPLKECEELEFLYLKSNPLTTIDLSPLAHLTNLKTLMIEDIKLTMFQEYKHEQLPELLNEIRTQERITWVISVERIITDFLELDRSENFTRMYCAQQVHSLRDSFSSLKPEEIDQKGCDVISNNISRFVDLIKLEGKIPPPEEWLTNYCLEQSAPLRQGLKDALKKYLRQQLLGEMTPEQDQQIQENVQEEIDKLMKQYREMESDKLGKS